MAEEGTHEIPQEGRDGQEETNEAQVETPGDEVETEAVTGAENGEAEEVAETGPEEVKENGSEETALPGTNQTAEEITDANDEGVANDQIVQEEPTEVNDQPIENEENSGKENGEDAEEENPKQEYKQGAEEETNDNDKISVPTTPIVDNVGTVTEESAEKHEVDPHAPSPPPQVSMDATATG